MIKIGDVYNLGSHFSPYMITYAKRLSNTYGVAFAIQGFEGKDLKTFLIWVINGVMSGDYPLSYIYVKEPYLKYFNSSCSIWVNLWNAAMHANPLGLGGESVFIPMIPSCPFYKLALISQMEDIMKKSSITDINLLSLLEKKLYELKVKILLTLDKDKYSQIDSYVCRVYVDKLLSSLPKSLRRRFVSAFGGMCGG